MNYMLPSQPALCRVIRSSPARYNPSDFDVLRMRQSSPYPLLCALRASSAERRTVPLARC